MPKPVRAKPALHRSDAALVDEAIEHLQSIWRQGLLQTVVTVGDYLIQQFFDGSLAGAASLSPTKPAALGRLLARAPEIGVSVHQLRVAVRIAAQYRQLPVAVAAELSVSHHELLLVVPPDDKLRLAKAAIKEELPKRAFLQLIRRDHPAHEGGRPPDPRQVVWLRSLERVMDEVAMKKPLEAEALRELSESDVRQMETRLGRCRERIDGILAACSRRPKRLRAPRA